ncbi:MAG: cytochrome c [Rhodospirillaceae bacterium]|nr:cytochrome c [Rhodospirillaceae bacterium]
MLIAVCAPQSTPLAETEDGRITAIMKLRHERMKNELGKSLNLIDDEVHGAAPDKAKIAEAAQILLTYSKEIPVWFPKGSGPETGWGLAKSEIWDKPDEFKAATARMIDTAGKLARAANTEQLPEITARFEAVAVECKGCHKAFRIPPT